MPNMSALKTFLRKQQNKKAKRAIEKALAKREHARGHRRVKPARRTS